MQLQDTHNTTQAVTSIHSVKLSDAKSCALKKNK